MLWYSLECEQGGCKSRWVNSHWSQSSLIPSKSAQFHRYSLRQTRLHVYCVWVRLWSLMKTVSWFPKPGSANTLYIFHQGWRVCNKQVESILHMSRIGHHQLWIMSRNLLFTDIIRVVLTFGCHLQTDYPNDTLEGWGRPLTTGPSSCIIRDGRRLQWMNKEYPRSWCPVLDVSTRSGSSRSDFCFIFTLCPAIGLDRKKHQHSMVAWGRP